MNFLTKLSLIVLALAPTCMGIGLGTFHMTPKNYDKDDTFYNYNPINGTVDLSKEVSKQKSDQQVDKVQSMIDQIKEQITTK